MGVEEKMNSDEVYMGDIGLSYELESKYRMYRDIEVKDGGGLIRFCGPYRDNSSKFEGKKDYNSWQQIVKDWVPGARIFAKLPVDKADYKRAIAGNSPYIVECRQDIEKIDKPFGYGHSDYWESYRFRNVDKSEAAKIIEKLLEQGCPKNKFNVGLELKVSDEELNEISKKKKKAIREQVDKMFDIEEKD